MVCAGILSINYAKWIWPKMRSHKLRERCCPKMLAPLCVLAHHKLLAGNGTNVGFVRLCVKMTRDRTSKLSF